MEPVHANPIPLATPNSQLNTLLTHFFDPSQTLNSIAAALGLTLEELLIYIAKPEVAAALDHTEDLILRRASLRATAAIEQVLRQLQSLPPLPDTPSQADTDRHRKNLEATRRAADLLRKTIAPQRAPAHRAPCQRTAAPRDEAPRHVARERPRAEPSPDSRPAWNQPAISFRSPTPAAPKYLAANAGARSILSYEELVALDRMARRDPSLYEKAPELFGTPYT
ncbi:MAG: hypothetical protein ACOYN0_20195, partial [Phycisphaerales bacterium]